MSLNATVSLLTLMIEIRTLWMNGLQCSILPCLFILIEAAKICCYNPIISLSQSKPISPKVTPPHYTKSHLILQPIHPSCSFIPLVEFHECLLLSEALSFAFMPSVRRKCIFLKKRYLLELMWIFLRWCVSSSVDAIVMIIRSSRINE